MRFERDSWRTLSDLILPLSLSSKWQFRERKTLSLGRWHPEDFSTTSRKLRMDYSIKRGPLRCLRTVHVDRKKILEKLNLAILEFIVIRNDLFNFEQLVHIFTCWYSRGRGSFVKITRDVEKRSRSVSAEWKATLWITAAVPVRFLIQLWIPWQKACLEYSVYKIENLNSYLSPFSSAVVKHLRMLYRFVLALFIPDFYYSSEFGPRSRSSSALLFVEKQIFGIENC